MPEFVVILCQTWWFEIFRRSWLSWRGFRAVQLPVSCLKPPAASLSEKRNTTSKFDFDTDLFFSSFFLLHSVDQSIVSPRTCSCSENSGQSCGTLEMLQDVSQPNISKNCRSTFVHKNTKNFNYHFLHVFSLERNIEDIRHSLFFFSQKLQKFWETILQTFCLLRKRKDFKSSFTSKKVRTNVQKNA